MTNPKQVDLPKYIPPFVERENVKHVASVSGGKDSCSVYLMLLELTGGDFVAAFADTGNEHPATLEYVSRLHERTGGPRVQIVKADFAAALERKKAFLNSGKAVTRSKSPWTQKRVNDVLRRGWESTGIPFLDLCRAKGMFPSRKVAFCSRELKRFPLLLQVQQPLVDAGYHVWSWQGIRAEESAKRACYPMWEQSPDTDGMTIFRPLMGWTVKDVAAIHRRHGLKLNPLYGLGFERVGCMPCINSSKKDIRLMAQQFPWAVGKIQLWEQQVRNVSRKGISTFFNQSKTPKASRTIRIEEVVRWSMTRRGGKRLDMMAYLPPPTSEVCVYAGGLCE